MSKENSKYRVPALEAAEQYLSESKAAKNAGKAEALAFHAAQKQRKADYKASLKALDKTERRAQKKGYKLFKKRINRTRRRMGWAVAVCLLLALIIALAPILSMTMGVLSSQSYSSQGEAAEAVREKGYALSAEICEEGFVLLKNDDELLPLDGVKLNIFGDDAYNFVYGGSGSSGADQSNALSLLDAFKQAGIAYNETLDGIYHGLGVSTGGGSGSTKEMVSSYLVGEKPKDDWLLLSDSAIAEAREYSDTALIVLSSMPIEGIDRECKYLQIMGDGMPNRAAMVDKVLNAFDHVIFIVNSGNVMELGFLNEYESADAALWVSSPGSLGCGVIADVLTGKINPSGRTVDTWVAAIESEPSYQTYGSYKYTNLGMYAMEYSEGIYVGYRYYETRYGADEKAYAENVVFPFGHGLSYTSFEQEITDLSVDKDTITVEIDVRNTGSVPGKDVAELYFMPPYYEASGIEKSAIELAGYKKTALLEPGASETLTIAFPLRDMASYAEAVDKGCYLLEKGEYKIALGRDVHDALLSDSCEVYTVTEDIKYCSDEKTGTEITNRFGFAQGDTVYLSRRDWDGTFPKAPAEYTASEELIAAKAEYEKGETEYAALYGGEPGYNAENGLLLGQLKGLDYDDPKWDSFLDQFTVKEMIELTANGGWHTVAIDRLGVKATHLLDGPSGINSMFTSVAAVAYPMATIVSSSWNDDIALRLGEAVGDEAAVYGVNGWYAPAMNIHRSSIGGRNSEYFSEDPLLSGRMAASAVAGAQSKGLVAFMKHFICNDMELNARSGIIIWVNEQALREIYLRPFEISVKEGGAYGVMSSFSFLGSKWCGGSSELMQDVLRDEWGFRGLVSTDAALGGWMNAELAVKNGNDLMLEMGLQASESKLNAAYKNDPVGLGWGLRKSVHNICYAMVNGTTLY